MTTLPVGGGVKPDSEVEWANRFVFGDSQSAEVAARIDAKIAKLPGLERFDRLTRSSEDSLARLATTEATLCPMIASAGKAGPLDD